MDQASHQVLMPAGLFRRHRIQWILAGIALLLALVVGSLGLAARSATQGRHVSRTKGDVAPAARDYRTGTPVGSSFGSLQEILAHPDVIATHQHPLLGRPAPDFELADSSGRTRNLRELQAGEPLVLIFYYGFECRGCVRDLYGANKDLPLFREVGARVVGISADPPELTRERFEQHGAWDFPVLSDPGNKVARAYQVFRGDFLRHGTFLIDRAGTVRWANVGDAPFRRNPALLYQLSKIQDRLQSGP
jgi:peroxiredoxin Q/BCP